MIIKSLIIFIWKNRINQYFYDSFLSKQNVIWIFFQKLKIKQININIYI